MNNIEKELLKTISKQITNNVPKLYIQEVVSGRVFEYGKNCHDKLIISEDGRCLTYYNLQNGDGSCVGDYRFYYEKPEDETDFDADEWARMVEHQSITQLLAEERKKVVQEIGTQLGLIIDGQKRVCCDGDMTGDKTIMAVLDQVERGE